MEIWVRNKRKIESEIRQSVPLIPSLCSRSFCILCCVLWHTPIRYSLRDGSGEVIILNSSLSENRFILILYLCLVRSTVSLMSSSDSCSSLILLSRSF